MLSTIKLILATLVFAFGFAIVLPAGTAQAANLKGNLCHGADDLKLSGNPEGCRGGEQTDSLNKLISTIINLFSLIVGIVAVIMIIYGGFRYITSGGDSGNITAAKHTIMYAIIGLIIVALAQVIVRFVLAKATSNSVASP